MSYYSLSVIIPVLNEAENLRLLLPELFQALRGIRETVEVLVIDDASVDGTEDLLRLISTTEPGLRGILLRKRIGKGSALALGARLSHGEIVLTMDGDGQDVPSMIPRLLRAIDEGAVLALGKRERRFDVWHRRWTSIFANAVIGRILGDSGLSDTNTGLRAYRRRSILDVPLCGGMFRFSAFFLVASGRSVVEVPVEHRARTYGQTRFPLRRRLRVFYDLIRAWMFIHIGSIGEQYPDDASALRTILFCEIQSGRISEQQCAGGFTVR